MSMVTFAQASESIPEKLAGTLESFSEKPLPAGRDAYRIVVWPTFHKPVLITIRKTDSGADVVAKTLHGQGGYEVGGIDSDKAFSISRQGFKKVERAFEKAKLESFPAREAPYVSGPYGGVLICLDGATWVIEQVVGDKYLYVERYCPAEKPLLEIGYVLLKTSGLKISKRELF